MRLSQSQRQSLEQVVQSASAPARKILHAHILLKADKGEQGPAWSDQQLRGAFEVGETMVTTVGKRFVEQGVEAGLNRRKQPARPEKQKRDGKQEAHLIAREPLAMKEGKVKREDYEYEREGFCSVFLACEPLSGKRFVQAKERRTKADCASFMRDLIDVHYREAETIVLVTDHLNIHTPGSFYQVFPPEEAMRLWKKLEIHYTPLHGSWLNMAEIELSVLARQALSGHLADLGSVQKRIAAWQAKGHAQQVCINWRFTTQDTRIKLKRLYPVIEV